MEQKQKKEEVGPKLSKLEEIVKWFETQNEVDVEKGLTKVKEGAALIKDLRKRMEAIQNEFQEIKKELEADEEEE